MYIHTVGIYITDRQLLSKNMSSSGRFIFPYIPSALFFIYLFIYSVKKSLANFLVSRVVSQGLIIPIFHLTSVIIFLYSVQIAAYPHLTSDIISQCMHYSECDLTMLCASRCHRH